MPVVTIQPKNKETEEHLAARMDEIRREVKKAICDVSGFPPNDVLVSLANCTMRDADPAAVNFILFADTCTHWELENRADELRDKIAKTLADLGLTGGSGAEVWLRFLPGSWCWVKNRNIEDSVSHIRTE